MSAFRNVQECNLTSGSNRPISATHRLWLLPQASHRSNGRLTHNVRCNKQMTLKLNVLSSIYILLCAVMILLIDAGLLSINQSLFHITQWVACFICFVSGVAFLSKHRVSVAFMPKLFVSLSSALSGLWLGFSIFVILAINFQGI